MSSLEAFSPCSDSGGQQRGVNLLGEKTIPWVLIPITGKVINEEVKNTVKMSNNDLASQYQQKSFFKVNYIILVKKPSRSSNIMKY